ncbi:translation initiation factor IF-2 [Ruficoccus amylovorans]|uniref:Translation initiation factor IF-2 n=1 Tax=Ruficoccus amylovorans TaxID=1804625 RepID=A0A842HC14_9BACT|nr:translation initiation factor IF-2 [Ruficoccus amylovorans]MBC2593608.1 translation initiation factor IF-2 [Ruficoccus amylovorans]
MSVRIYELSKELNMENKEVMQLLRERGHEVKSASSTVDNISAQALIEEFSGAAQAETPEQETAEAAPAPDAVKSGPATPKLPPSAIVKTPDQIAQEKREKEAEEEAARQRREDERAAVRQAQRDAMLSSTQKPAAATPAEPERKSPPPPPPPGARRAPIPAPVMGPGRPATPSVNVSVRPAQPAVPPRTPGVAPAPSVQPRAAGGAPAPVVPPASAVPPRTSGAAPAPAVPPRHTPGVAPAPSAPAASTPPGATPPPVKMPASVRPSPSPIIPPSIPRPAQPGQQPQPGQQASAAGKVIEKEGETIIQIKPPIVVRDFAILLGKKPFQLISELMEMGIFASMNQAIEEANAKQIAERHGFTLDIRHRGDDKPEPKKKAKAPREDDPALMEERPPVVCVLGHVDHGKTSLLDQIRNAHVVSGEAGGITQHVGAYQVERKGKKITFLDTPGHAAFSKIRERGANVTDIAILVVAADDGFMPQTDEALKFARNANVEIIVAINKMDAKGANIDRVKQQMQERDLMPEDWGGTTLCTPVSALEGTNINELLELVLLQAEVSELKANPKAVAEGVIVESQVEQGRGPTATVIVQKGTLKVGDALVCGPHYCKVRAMMDEHGKPVKSAPPSTPVRIMGWSGTPVSGAVCTVAKNEKAAKAEAEENAQALKARAAAKPAVTTGATDLDSLLAAIDDQSSKVLRVVIKGDVNGSVEALADCLRAIESEKVKLEIVETGVGVITKNDITLADSSEACVIGFNVKQENGVTALAKHHGVRIIQHNIIYELITSVEEAMSELLDPEYREVKLGMVEVRATFPLAKGLVAGCMVTEGIIKRDAHARLIRKEVVIHEGRIGTLKRFKEDVNEVRAGYECGIQVSGTHDYKEGDRIECYEIHEFRPNLR